MPLDAPLTGGLRAAFVPLHASAGSTGRTAAGAAGPPRSGTVPCSAGVGPGGGGQREAERPHGAKLRGCSDVRGRRHGAGGEVLAGRRTRGAPLRQRSGVGGTAGRAGDRRAPALGALAAPHGSARLFVQVCGTTPLGASASAWRYFAHCAVFSAFRLHRLSHRALSHRSPRRRPPPLLVGGGARGGGAGRDGGAGTCAAGRGAARGAALLPLPQSSPRRRE